MAKMYEIKLCNTTTRGAIYAAYAVFDDPEDTEQFMLGTKSPKAKPD
jgi:hypothetical protein